MSAEKHLKCVAVALLLPLGLLLSACVMEKKYTYEDIQKQYADVVCNISPVASGSADAMTCVLNAPVSLSQAIKIALTNNPDTKMALFRVRQAESMIARANARFYPAIRLYTEYIQGDAPSAYLFKTIDQRLLPAKVDFNDPGWFDNYESGLLATLNVYNGGKDTLERQMAENSLAMENFDRDAVNNGLVAAVIKAYYTAMAAADFAKIAQDSVATVEAQHRVMQVRFDAGGALKSDVLSLEVRLAQAREEVIRYGNRHSIALTALGNLLGVSPETGVRISSADMADPLVPQTYLEGMIYAMDHRPEVRKARLAVVQSKMALDKASAGYLPRLDVVAKYYADDPAMNYSTDRDNWTAALLMNWDVFTGFSTKADKMQANAILEEMLAADRKTVLSIKSDVKTAYLNVDAARARLTVAEKSVVSAEETLKLVIRQYEGGSATVTRYLEAELARNLSRINTTAAYYDGEKARADLGRAVGYWTTMTQAFQDDPKP